MRSVDISQWLATTDWANWTRTAMTGDASARSYERLVGPRNQSVILMDAPPETCGSQSRFVEIAKHLSSLGLKAPDILDWDDLKGFLILSDLGQTDFAQHLIHTPNDEKQLYTKTVDVLQIIQSAPPPNGLIQMTPDVGADMIGLAFEWAATDQSPDLTAEITTGIRSLLHRVDPNPNCLSLRDFHAENLIWRPQERGTSRIGLLDFQDAFITHPAYDLASFLRDARRDVDPNLLDTMLVQLAGDTHEVSDFRRAFHVMAVQRNLRILGIFNRLAKQDGKAGYLNLIPRVWSHLLSDLDTPDLADLAPLITRAFGAKEI